MAVRRIMIITAYDGTDYSGWAMQKDPAIPTIEGELKKAVEDLTGERINLQGASRTDAGVHALCNYAVFDTHAAIPPEKYAPALNTRLPQSIRIRKSREVDRTFNPRDARTLKTYEYHILNCQIPVPTMTRYAVHTYFRLDVGRMRQGAEYLIGEHDFRTFCNAATQAQTTVREITNIGISERNLPIPAILYGKKNQPAKQDLAREIILTVQGKGFLYNMVRIIAGTLMEVGRGLREPEDVKTMLEARDRQAAGPTAPANGLILTDYRILP